MKQNRVEAFVRTLMVLALALFGAGALSAQTGKIDGHVRNEQGQPIAEASVTVVGTAFTTTTNKDGYFFINNVPAGVVDVRIAIVGYTPQTIGGVRIVTGQTYTTKDITLARATQVTLNEIRVEASQPLIDRNLNTTKQTLDKDFIKNLPENRISTLLALSPGVSRPLVGDTTRLSVRGSRYTENNLYVDGVPVQRMGALGNGIEFDVATNAFEDVSLTTGAPSAQFGNALGGIVNITTRSGGAAFQSSLRWDTGMLGGAYAKGQNTFSLNVSGPTPVKNLTFNTSAYLEGTAWTNTGFEGWKFPVYTTVGIDTTFMVGRAGTVVTSAPFNNPRADSIPLNVYKMAVISGDCDKFFFVKDASLPEMRDNYGVSCEKSRTFVAPSTRYQANGRLDYGYGKGGRLSASYNWTGNQSRPRLLTDGRQTGTIANATVASFQLTQPLVSRANRNITLKATASFQGNNDVTSPMTVESEKSSRHPFSGFMLKKLDLVYGPENFPIDSTIIKNFLTQTPFRTSLLPTVDANTGGAGGATVSSGLSFDGVPYRDYYSNTGGNDVSGFTWSKETRRVLDASIDAQVDRYNRFQIGATHTKTETKNFSGAAGTSNWFRPVLASAYINDRIDLSDIVLDVGLRWDYFDYNLKRWVDFPRISTNPNFDRNNPDRVMKEDKSHSYLAPRIQVAFPITQQTNFRLSYAQQAQAPGLNVVELRHKYDIDRSGINSRSTFGADIDYAKSIQFEFGVSHAFSDDMTMEVVFYNKDNLANAAYKFANRIDPSNNQSTQLYLLQNTDFGNSRGIEVSMNRQIGQYLNGRINYSYADTRNTGSDPNAFLNFFESILGGLGEPPLQALPTAQSVPHTINGVVNLTLPSDFKRGTLFGKVFGGLGVGATFQLQSGAPYTRCDPQFQQNAAVLSDAASACTNLNAVQGYLASRLPMTKMLNTSFRRTFNFGKRSVAAYLNVNNILNLTNTYRVYAVTGTINNPPALAQQWSNDSVTFTTAAINHGFYNNSNGSMTLPGSTAACAKVGNTTQALTQSCFYWIRSEQRFGNGDGIYTLDEYRRVSDVINAKSRHISNFVRGFRTMVFGVTVNF